MRKHRGYEEQRGKIPISNPLEDCPRTAEKRSRLGHWVKAGKACLMTANDRKSRLTIVKKLTNKSAKRWQKPWFLRLRGIIYAHLRLTEKKNLPVTPSVLGVEFYFPEPHQPWQRGTNENTNGLLIEYFSNQQDISQWNDDKI